MKHLAAYVAAISMCAALTYTVTRHPPQIERKSERDALDAQVRAAQRRAPKDDVSLERRLRVSERITRDADAVQNGVEFRATMAALERYCSTEALAMDGDDIVAYWFSRAGVELPSDGGTPSEDGVVRLQEYFLSCTRGQIE